MPTKVSIGLSKKAGLPDFGSVGASCHVELELDAYVLEGDQERFRQHVRRAYSACQNAIDEELSRARPEAPGTSSSSRHAMNGNGRSQETRADDRRGSSPRTATQSQVRAIKAIASRQRLDLGPRLEQSGVRTVEDLSVHQASVLIDELKGQPAGTGGGR